jgi:glucosylceramidase
MFRFTCLLLILFICSSALFGQTVQVYQTTPDFSQAIKQQTPLTFTSAGTASQTITINDAKTYQQMDGFGAAMTDSSAWVLYTKLSTAQRSDVMTKLFDRTNGIALRFTRVPMGSSDESVTVYSYDDLCTPSKPTDYCTTPNGTDGKMLSDPTLANFSIAHDMAYIIPTLQQARDIAAANNEKIKLMANPWRMKTNGSMLGTANGVAGTLKPEAYDPLAQYFVKFVQGYSANGLHIDYISMQNEPQYAPGDYSGLMMSSTEQANFLANNIGPAFAEAGLDAKFMVWDHNWDNMTFPEAVLSNAAANKYAAGVAWHHYAGNPAAMSVVHDLYPDKDVWETEASMFAGDSLSHVGVELINTTRNWARSYVLWDLANDQNMGPHVGGCGTCRPVVTIDYSDPNNVKYILTTDYYALGQASKFVLPGAYHIDSDEQTINGLYDVAFRNPDGSIVVFVTNTSGLDQTFNLKYGDKFATATIKGSSIATFVWNTITPSSVSLSAQPNGLTLTPGQSGSVNLTVTPVSGNPTVTIGCQVVDYLGNVTTDYTCAAAQPNLTFPDTTPQSTTVTITPKVSNLSPDSAPPTKSAPLSSSSAAVPLVGLGMLNVGKNRRRYRLLGLLALVVGMLAGCGGGSSTTTPPPPPTPQAAAPVFNLASGTFTSAQTVTITDSTPGATIYYTTDGSTPTASSTKYTTAMTVSTTQTIRAMATASGYTDSVVASATYTIAAATPVFSPAAGTFTSAQTVTITDTTPGATIYYTIDGSTPTTSSTQYMAAIPVSSTETIKAIAAASGYTNSDVASATYTIVPPYNMVITATTNDGTQVTLTIPVRTQ